jgi:uncharacterized radical SAM superfamily Fe-S cluster-containing enzyme
MEKSIADVRLEAPIPSLIKTTTSRCPTCKVECQATIWRIGNDIFMDRICPEHNLSQNRIGTHPFYWHSVGASSGNCCSGGSCCSPGSNIGTLGKNALAPTNNIEALATCTALIDIVDSCNLKCPTCYAESPFGIEEELKYTPFDEFVSRVQGVLDRKGKIELLQLSGGEPTLHPDFFKILLWVFENPGIDQVLINTNGVRLATDDQFVSDFKKVFRLRKMRLYLQYDGPQEAGQKALRAADLRQIRIRAIERCAEIGLTLHLAMTVNHDNMPYLWDALVFGTTHKNVLGISFQPMFLSGRNQGNSSEEPITAGDVVMELIDQSNGVLISDDFTPLPCGDPNCQIVSGLARIAGELVPVVRHIDRANIDQVLRNKISFDIEDLKKCGCEDQPIAEILMNQVLLPEYGFFIFIKPFMDARTWDDDRIDRCCTHVIRPDGELDSFCRYYSGFPGTYNDPEKSRGVALTVRASN